MKYIERAYSWVLLAPVVLPVVVWGGFIYPYLVPKTLLFYAISFVAMGMFAILAAHGRAFFWSRLSRWEAWVPGALVALAYVASLAGIDFYRSFWSLFVRGDGLLMLTCAVASFYLILLSANRTFFERLLRAVALVGSIVAVYGIGEWLVDGGRIGSLLGNAAFFAGYLGIAFFATLAAGQSLSRNWRRAAYGGAALQLIAIILTATRGTILALALAGVAYLVYKSFRKPPVPKPKNGVRLGLAARSAPLFGFGTGGSVWARALLAILVISGGIFFVFRADLAKVPFAPIARVASIGQSDPDVASRLFIWKNMTTEIEKSPVLGVGAEHVDVLFNRFYDPTQISEQWFDRSHNAFLDYAAQYGIGGLVLYLALILAFFTTAAR
ncbi:MAG: O-antigen ligase family protein, partial [Minisyncoccota bacterium]